MRTSAVLLLALLLALPPAEAAAQSRPPPSPRETPDAAGQLATLSANAVLSGLAAGVVQKLRGGSFQDGLARGALGGGVAFLGKRLAVERFDGAGLAGRQVAALGNSIVGNAAAGRGTLERLVFPVGFARLYLHTGEERPRARVRIDLHGLAWAAYAAATPELRFDAGASLSAGAPVFRSPRHVLSWDETGDEVAGTAPAGVILLSDHSEATGGVEVDPVIFAHERVHVIQYDQFFAAASDPLQEWILPRLPGGAALGRVVDVDFAAPLLYGVSLWHDGYEGRPWEREAYFLAGR